MEKKKVIESVVQSPAFILDKTIETSMKVGMAVSNEKHIQQAKDYWEVLGPGLTTGASDDDPSGIATYSQTGSQFGFKFLWLAPFTFPLMSLVQEMCARIGLVTGRGLASNIRLLFPRWVLYLCTGLLFAANAFNIGADLGAMSEATRLILPKMDFQTLVCIYAIGILFLQIFTTYKNYAKYLKWLALVLLAYVISTIMIKDLQWNQILLSSIKPSLSFTKESFLLICAILGTTISPYLFFWQTSQEVEEEVLRGKTNLILRQSETTKKEVNDMRIDVWSGMFLSNLVMFFIITACAATLNLNGITDIKTAAQAADALKPFAGEFSSLLFALGIIGTGLLAIPVLAGSSSYAFAESFGFKHGLHYKLRQAYSFYGMIIISIGVGLGLNFIGLDPIKALIYSAVINGVVAPVILVMIVLISSNNKVMGKWTNAKPTTWFGWLVVGIMALVALGTLISLLF